MANPFVHVELHTGDLAKAREFYSGLFDWDLQDLPMPGGTYTMINVGEGTGGGMMSRPDAPPQWLAYIGVDDAVCRHNGKSQIDGGDCCPGCHGGGGLRLDERHDRSHGSHVRPVASENAR